MYLLCLNELFLHQKALQNDIVEPFSNTFPAQRCSGFFLRFRYRFFRAQLFSCHPASDFLSLRNDRVDYPFAVIVHHRLFVHKLERIFGSKEIGLDLSAFGFILPINVTLYCLDFSAVLAHCLAGGFIPRCRRNILAAKEWRTIGFLNLMDLTLALVG